MSGIESLDSVSDFSLYRNEKKEELIEPTKDVSNDGVKDSMIQSQVEQQDQKTTVQASQYTGKGSFIDKVF